jgi:hypothetical protein
MMGEGQTGFQWGGVEVVQGREGRGEEWFSAMLVFGCFGYKQHRLGA